jgi:hypothetical protein
LIDAGVGLEDALLFEVLPVDLGNLCFGGACRMHILCSWRIGWGNKWDVVGDNKVLGGWHG